MSVNICDTNALLLGPNCCYFTLPTLAGQKAANVSAVFGMWAKTPPLGFERNKEFVAAGRGGAYTGGNDAYLRFPQNAQSLECVVRNGGSQRFNQTLTGLTAGAKMLILLIINPTACHLVACTPGGSPLVISDASAVMYGQAFTATSLITSLGGGTNANAQGFYGPIENAFFIHGAFPESSGVPDATLIQNLASGAQAISGLAALLTGGSNRFHYGLKHLTDISDRFALFGDLVTTGEDKPVGKLHTNGPQLRPDSIRPADASGVSQVVFDTAGDDSTAFCRIKTQGGTYSGITPADIQARLRKEDGSALVDWVSVATPSGGAWGVGQLPNVPITAGWLALDFRALDSAGAQLGDIVSGGIRGAGFHANIWAQSQCMFLWDTGAGLAIPSGIRIMLQRQLGTGHRCQRLGSADPADRGIVRGMRQAAIEINTLFPGVPIEFSSVGEAGQAVEYFGTGGVGQPRWALLAAAMGLIQPHIRVPMGHSSGADATYLTKFIDVLANASAALGEPLKYVPIPVPRYKLAGATLTSSALQVHESRKAQREWHEANLAKSYWGGSASVVHTADEIAGSSDPHPADSDLGQGRSGSIIGWRIMEAVRAVPSETIGLVGGEWAGNSVKLYFSRASGVPSY